MQLVVGDARFFKSCVDAASNLVDEGNFEVTVAGMHLRSMDPSQIAMVDLLLPKEAFEKLNAEPSATLGINLIDLGKVLARARPDEKLTISLEEKENRLLLEFVGESKRHFKMPLLDLGGTPPKEPKISFDAHVKLRASALKDMLRDAGLLSSHVVLHAAENDFVVEAHGDSGDLVIETPKDAASVSEFKSGAKARAMYPYEYLDDITRAAPDDAVISIELKNDAPVRISYEIGHAKLAYYLAPRVEAI